MDIKLKAITMAAIAAGMGPVGMKFYEDGYRKEKPLKNCLHCGTPHQHNNSYCSASCCKEHRINPSTVTG